METKRCPYCDEEIMSNAKKCKHCGEWLVKPPKTTEVQQKQKKDEEFTNAQIGFSALIVIILALLPIGILLFIAHATVPSESDHYDKVMDDVRTCVKDEFQNAGDDAIPGLGSLASLIMDNGITDSYIDKYFNRSNRIKYEKSLFWSSAYIVNSKYKNGTKVSFGIFGFVIPAVEWDDIVLLTDEEKQELMKSHNNEDSD